MSLPFTGLEDKSSRAWTFQEHAHKHSPAVGTYNVDHSVFTERDSHCGIYPPFGSYTPRDTVDYIFEKNGRDTPDTIYDVRNKQTKGSPKITSVFKDNAPRFRPLKGTKLASCDHSPVAVWFPRGSPKRPSNARARNKTVALLLEIINRASRENKHLYYNGPKVSARGRANSYTVDAEGNVFEKGGDTVPYKVTTEAGCLGPAQPILRRFCGGNFSRSGRKPLFQVMDGPGPGHYTMESSIRSNRRPAHGSDTPTVLFEKALVVHDPDVVNGSYPGIRESQLFKERAKKRKSESAKNNLVGGRIKYIVSCHEKLLDQYTQVLDATRATPIGFNSTTTREHLIDMDVPPVTAYTDTRSAFHTNTAKLSSDPEQGFLTKAARFPLAEPTEPKLSDPPQFLNMREQIRSAQTSIHAAFGSFTPRTSPFTNKPDTAPPPNTYTLPTSIEVSVRNDRPVGKDKHGQFPWQGWRAKESGFKRYLDRVPPPGWYNVAKSFKLACDKRTFHRPFLAKCPPAFDSSSTRTSSLLSAHRPTPAPNRYSCGKWWKAKNVRHHGATFPKEAYRSLFDVKPVVSPGPADHHIATILSSSVARRSFNSRFRNQYSRPWTQIHPPTYRSSGKIRIT